MRSAERAIRTTCLALVSVLLAACTALPNPFAPSTSAGAPNDVKAASTGAVEAGGKPAPLVAKPDPAPIAPAVQRAFDDARQALASGRLVEAERGFSALTKSSPELAGPYANLGVIHRQAGRTAEAVAALEKAVQLSPQRADLANQLGLAYRTAGDFAKARASYERSIALDASYGAAVLNLGILHDLYLWDGARALELYERYIQLEPNDAQVKRWITDLRNRTTQKDAAQRKEQG
jgi:tetratricopeptide (TPR) repeat protein